MENEESPKSVLQMPILSRLDRLDRLVQNLEEKQGLSQRYSYPYLNPQNCADPQENDHHGTVVVQKKPLSSALHEATIKGTLTDRVAMLENRVLQLTLDVEESGSFRYNSPCVSASDHHCIQLMISQRRCDPAAIAVQAVVPCYQGKEMRVPVPNSQQAAEGCSICRKPRDSESRDVEMELIREHTDTDGTELCVRKRRTNPVISHYRKWVRWIRLGC